MLKIAGKNVQNARFVEKSKKSSKSNQIFIRTLRSKNVFKIQIFFAATQFCRKFATLV
jgi:hypothetical protein